MATYPNLGGMLTQAGQQQGQVLGGAFTGLAQDLMKPVDSMLARKKNEGLQKEVQDFLAANKEDPAALNAEAARYTTMGKNDIAKVFSDAAQAAVERSTRRGEIADKSRERADVRAEAVGKKVDAQGEELQRYRLEQNAMAVARKTIKDPNRLEATEARLKDATAEELKTFLTDAGKVKKPEKPDKLDQVTEEVVENGKPVKYRISYDPYTGEQKARVRIGEVAEDEDNNKSFMDTKAGSDLYNKAVIENNTVKADISKFEGIISQSEELADSSGMIGGIVGTFRDFAVSDIAGLGDEITAFRTSLNEIQMQKALALLPKGPASDRDVQLALNASPDLKDYNEEQRLSALRGMKKILEARQEYVEGKIRWMEITNDPNAIGYERYAEIQGLDKSIDVLTTEFPQAVEALDNIVKQALEAKNLGDDETYRAKMAEAEAIDANLNVGKNARGQDVKGLGYLDMLKERGKARSLLDSSLKKRGYTYEELNYV
ncbi:MAG: hypothetical protein P8J32_02085 [bacterium]|nr:hypothetical protein [bacterium]